MDEPTDEEVQRVAHAIAGCSVDSFDEYARVAISEMREIEREKVQAQRKKFGHTAWRGTMG